MNLGRMEKDGTFLRMEWKGWKKLVDGMEKDGREKSKDGNGKYAFHSIPSHSLDLR